MDEALLRSVSLYFHLTIEDERRAHAASLNALSQIRRMPSKTNKALIILILHKLRAKASRLRIHHWPFKKEETSWSHGKLDMQVWRTFMSRAYDTEVEAVLLSRVLGFSDIDIANGLGVSEGTIRYRVGRGLRTLGGIADNG